MLCAFQCKSQNRTLLFVAISNICMAISTAMFQNWILVGTHSLATLRDIVYVWQRKRRPNNEFLRNATLVFFIGASLAIFYFTRGWWYTYLIQAAALLVILTSWLRGTHPIRIGRIIRVTRRTIARLLGETS